MTFVTKLFKQITPIGEYNESQLVTTMFFYLPLSKLDYLPTAWALFVVARLASYQDHFQDEII